MITVGLVGCGGVTQTRHLPGHNSSYKRAILLDYGPALEMMLESETVLHWDLRKKGHQLYLEPRAMTCHVNFSLPSSWLKAQFYSGRLFAAARRRQWPAPRRLLYALAAPLIPFVRLRRILQVMPSKDNERPVPRSVPPMLLIGLAASAAGEMTGYFRGAGNAREKMSRLEFHRDRHTRNQDGASL